MSGRDVVSDPPRRDPDSVYQVITSVATSPEGWEQAIAEGVRELARSIDDLRVAKVLETDLALDGTGSVLYRVRFAASFRVDRRRRLPGGHTTAVRRYLVVASQTAGGRRLHEEIERRIAVQPAEFHLLMPILLPSAEAARWADPMTGTTVPAPVEGDADGDAIVEAEQRLDDAVARIRAAGGSATGEVSVADPVKATLAVLGRGSFDEIILSTLPGHLSKWLRLDLPSRLQRATRLPITHVEAAEAPAGAGAGAGAAAGAGAGSGR